MLLIAAACSGCGTIRTVGAENDDGMQVRYAGKHSYCESMPRLYSGVAYDFCILNGPPAGASANPSGAVDQLPWPIADIPLSIVADSVVLPYTLYTQIRYGNIPVSRPSAQ